MNIAQIEENVKNLLNQLVAGECEQDSFIYKLLLAYGHRKQSVTRLRSGERNLAKNGDLFNHSEVIWKRQLYFKHVDSDSLHEEFALLRQQKRIHTEKLRFIIVTDFKQLLAVDSKTNDSLDIELAELGKQFDFFLPWAGMEKAVYQGENPADIKAAEKMAKLFDLIRADNFDEQRLQDKEALHQLNVFLTRLLFCFFAEDTEIFANNQFSKAIESHTKEDGSDLSVYLDRLFEVLNTANADRSELPDYLSDFPYVNGGLFTDNIASPHFSAKARRMLIQCGGELDWSDINPDIFGSMIQAVVHPDQRGNMGMHYTSVTNIMKVIEPLFLNDLYEELAKVENNEKQLQKLQQRLGEIKIFDPACGSGNFLIIAYKELRKLEMELLRRLQEIELEKIGQLSQPFSVLKLSQFYGVELDDFAHEVAILSLWLAEHQMNVEFKTEFGEVLPSLPLKSGGNVVCGNALRLNWLDVCEGTGEIYIIGNPPYLGTKNQNDDQKIDVKNCFSTLTSTKHIDYIACWFMKASNFINAESKFSFVSTNSIFQGAQVSLLWPVILGKEKEIIFAHKDFRWENNAKDKAGVTCSIIGVGFKSKNVKTLFFDDRMKIASRINPYLIDAKDTYVCKSKKPISALPILNAGNDPREGGNLIFSRGEKEEIIKFDSRAEKFLRKVQGASDFVQGTHRWCIWLNAKTKDEALEIQPIKERVERVKAFREGAGKIAYSCKDRPYQFFMHKVADKSQIVVPFTSSQRRDYLPIGYLGSDVIVTNALNVLFDADPYIFGVLSSRMHIAWVRVVSGKMKTDFRYSVGICYNAFPFPLISPAVKNKITEASFQVLAAREAFSEKNISYLYDPNTMPSLLRDAHQNLDRIIEKAYRAKPFASDEERTECLFDLYSKMTGVENA